MKAIRIKIAIQILCVGLVVGWVSTARGQVTTNAYSQAVLADSPVVYYQFEETNGATEAFDSSGNGNAGTYNNVSLNNPGATARLVYAAGFSGSSFVAVPALGSAISLGGSGNNQCTIECWINFQSAEGAAIYANDNWAPGSINYLWDWVGPEMQFSLNGNTPTDATFNSNPPIPLGQWAYAVSVYNAAVSNVVSYINGCRWPPTFTRPPPR
jgi:hypothetical protein